MGTSRAHARISRPADEVWDAVTDPNGIVAWFPGVAGCTHADGVRHVTTSSGIEVDEVIVTNDGQLRRFQYSLQPGAVPVEQHLATVDVVDDGDGSLVIYSVDVAPDAFAPAMQQTIEAAVAGLKAHVEQAG
ncbi:MAG: hypothetical protein JWM12_1723 [Ilumatobacteraceae bacterium]|jgi:uncharacterized protein YndB with AHSA1/START domain|nr:hypothetical protein [Ilumatobacteraceae bacterium]